MAREGRKDGVWEEGRPQSRKRSRGLWGPMGYCCHGDSRVDELKRRKLQLLSWAEQNWAAQNKGYQRAVVVGNDKVHERWAG